MDVEDDFGAQKSGDCCRDDQKVRGVVDVYSAVAAADGEPRGVRGCQEREPDVFDSGMEGAAAPPVGDRQPGHPRAANDLPRQLTGLPRREDRRLPSPPPAQP